MVTTRTEILEEGAEFLVLTDEVDVRVVVASASEDWVLEPVLTLAAGSEMPEGPEGPTIKREALEEEVEAEGAAEATLVAAAAPDEADTA